MATPPGILLRAQFLAPSQAAPPLLLLLLRAVALLLLQDDQTAMQPRDFARRQLGLPYDQVVHGVCVQPQPGARCWLVL